MIIFYRFLFLIYFLSATSFASENNLRSEMIIKIGEMNSVKIKGIIKIAIANADIINYQLIADNEIFLIPKKIGKTEMKVWSTSQGEKSILIKIEEDTLEEELRLAKELTSNYSGLKVNLINNKIIFSGEVKKEDEENYKKIIEISKNYTDLVHVDSFKMERMIKLNVQIIEVSKKAIQQLGIRWNQSAAGPAVGFVKNMHVNDYFAVASDDGQDIAKNILASIPLKDKTFFGYSGMSSSLGSQLDLLAETGDARILAKPELVTRHGEKASFHSGGQFPIQKTTALGQTEIDYVDYGIKLEIEPVIDNEGNIKTFIFAEISNIDPSMQVSTVPGFLTRKVETVINVKNQQTMIISGLTSVDSSIQESKVPYLGDIPIVGKILFKSKQTIKKETEVVIFVTPNIVENQNEIDQKVAEIRSEFYGLKEKNIVLD